MTGVQTCALPISVGKLGSLPNVLVSVPKTVSKRNIKKIKYLTISTPKLMILPAPFLLKTPKTKDW